MKILAGGLQRRRVGHRPSIAMEGERRMLPEDFYAQVIDVKRFVELLIRLSQDRVWRRGRPSTGY
jgi:hypothetical protein